MSETRVVFYKSKRKMRKKIKVWEACGWTVKSVDVVPGRYGCWKTGCLAVIFLPLALLGKKPDQYKVVYQYKGGKQK